MINTRPPQSCGTSRAFNSIAPYYHALYSDKRTSEECRKITELVDTYGGLRAPGTLLDLGCGTGRHAALFAAHHGFAVLGVEKNDRMIKHAQFYPIVHGDITKLHLGPKKFDVAVALFDVVSYLTTNKELTGLFESVHRHLKPGGLFIFDAWYTPAVRVQGLQVRVKEVLSGDVIRIARPTAVQEENVCGIDYTLLVRNSRGQYDRSDELHLMRHFEGADELAEFYRPHFRFCEASELLTNASPDPRTWSVCYVLRAAP